MAIIIDEFEVVVEPPPSPAPTEESPLPPADQQSRLKPEDIAAILAWEQARLRRLWAD